MAQTLDQKVELALGQQALNLLKLQTSLETLQAQHDALKTENERLIAEARDHAADLNDLRAR